MSRQSSWDCKVISLPGAVYIVLMNLGRHFVAVSDGLNVRLAMKVRTSGGVIFYHERRISLPQRYRFFFSLLALLFPALHHDTLPSLKETKS